jgi:hypothetical protein
MLVTIEADAPLPSIPKAAAPPLRTVRRSTIFVSIGFTALFRHARVRMFSAIFAAMHSSRGRRYELPVFRS